MRTKLLINKHIDLIMKGKAEYWKRGGELKEYSLPKEEYHALKAAVQESVRKSGYTFRALPTYKPNFLLCDIPITEI